MQGSNIAVDAKEAKNLASDGAIPSGFNPDKETSAEIDMRNYGTPVNPKKKPVYSVIKRALDIFCSLLALILLSWLFAIVAIAIYVDDPGDIIFKQVRIGKDLKPFTIYKFRSMRMDAEKMLEELKKQNQGKGLTFEMKHDPRRTKVGKFIRKTSIDELPQLINILRGEMSIIGPRPFVPEEQALLPDDRLSVTPGLSCYWQVRGKNKLTAEQQIEYDRKYIKDRSLLVDFLLVCETAGVIFKKKNR